MYGVCLLLERLVISIHLKLPIHRHIGSAAPAFPSHVGMTSWRGHSGASLPLFGTVASRGARSLSSSQLRQLLFLLRRDRAGLLLSGEEGQQGICRP